MSITQRWATTYNKEDPQQMKNVVHDPRKRVCNRRQALLECEELKQTHDGYEEKHSAQNRVRRVRRNELCRCGDKGHDGIAKLMIKLLLEVGVPDASILDAWSYVLEG